MEGPTSQMRMTREPNEIEEEWIQDFIMNRMGQAYVMDSNGLFSELQKPPCTLKYYCGKVEVYDEEHHLLHETGCCHCPYRTASLHYNCAEYCMTWGICAFAVISILSFARYIHASGW